MKALVLEKPEDYRCEEIEKPQIKPDEVLVRVLSSGICVNDIRDFKGGNKVSYPRIGGHEYCGEVVELGSEVDSDLIQIGDHVIPYIIDYCGICDDCKHDHENICQTFTKGVAYSNPHGYSGFYGFGEYAAVPARRLHVYPKETPSNEAALTEPLACVINSIQRCHIGMGDNVVVIGGGTMGMLHVLCAKKQGAFVILSEPDEERRKFGLDLGADVVINPLDRDAIQQVKDLTNGRGANVVFNTTAIPAVAAQAIEMTAKSGYCNMFSSIHPNDPILVNAGRLHSQEIYVTGTQNGTVETFQRAIDCISKRIIDVRPLIDKIFQPEEVAEAMAYASKPDTYKCVFEFSK